MQWKQRSLVMGSCGTALDAAAAAPHWHVSCPVPAARAMPRRCKPKKCKQECKKSCPVVKVRCASSVSACDPRAKRQRQRRGPAASAAPPPPGCPTLCPATSPLQVGKLCVEVTANDKIAWISEDLCIGCGICVKVSPPAPRPCTAPRLCLALLPGRRATARVAALHGAPCMGAAPPCRGAAAGGPTGPSDSTSQPSSSPRARLPASSAAGAAMASLARVPPSRFAAAPRPGAPATRRSAPLMPS